MTDEPIIPMEFTSGATVVDIGDIRVSRGLTRRPASSCAHRKLHYDNRERRVWCPDCEKEVDPFDAFMVLVGAYDEAERKHKEREQKLREAEAEKLISLAAKEIDRVWRKRDQVPACPCCGEGILPEDFKSGCRSIVGRDYAIARRKRLAEQRKTGPRT